eukprot:3132793-Rhodomonas_salina.1
MEVGEDLKVHCARAASARGSLRAARDEAEKRTCVRLVRVESGRLGGRHGERSLRPWTRGSRLAEQHARISVERERSARGRVLSVS